MTPSADTTPEYTWQARAKLVQGRLAAAGAFELQLRNATDEVYQHGRALPQLRRLCRSST